MRTVLEQRVAVRSDWFEVFWRRRGLEILQRRPHHLSRKIELLGGGGLEEHLYH